MIDILTLGAAFILGFIAGCVAFPKLSLAIYHAKAAFREWLEETTEKEDR